MLRKNFLFIALCMIFSLLLTACTGEEAQDQTFTIGIVNLSPNIEDLIDAFKEGMTEFGYIEGENITYIYEGPAGVDKLDGIAQELVEAKVDLILSLTTPATLAAQRATADTEIPVLFIPVTDPVGAGIVDSLTRPGGNITGVTYFLQEGRRLEWLVQVAPTIEQVFIPYNPDDPSPVAALGAVSKAAEQLNVELITQEVRTPEDVAAAFANIPEEADAVFFLPDSLVNTNTTNWFDITTELKLPTSGPNTATVEDGALTAYGIDLNTSARTEASRLANQILQGAEPANLPVEMAEFFFALNLQLANTMGIDISDEILEQADIIIR